MVKINIDGKEIEADPSKTIIEVAGEAGISIPHFCWHPRLSVSGNCRMCLVEVEKSPKLAVACATKVTDGMVVHTENQRVIKAREAVMEFILINHPLDCPICDEAGECKLQDYSYKYSRGYSRFDDDKVRKPKRVELGPNVMLDAERCIMCSRCVRFTDEIASKPQLVFTQRGDRIELTTAPGEQLDNPYSMNVVELCPVGALTSRDFRFKARVWEMSATESICTGCARGCNTNVWVRNNEILRLTPRFNPDVNDYWMCDYGRLNTFKCVNSETRVKAPLLRRNGDLVEVGWEEVIAEVVNRLQSFNKMEVAGIGSPFRTNEDNYIFAKLIKNIIGTPHIDFLSYLEQGEEDDLLIRADKTPNSLGAREVGVFPNQNGINFKQIIKAIESKFIKCLYLIDDRIPLTEEFTSALVKIDYLIIHATNINKLTAIADVVLPASTYAEMNGTFTNFQGRVQWIKPAVATVELDRSLDGMALSRLDKFGAPNDRWMKWNKRDARPTWRILSHVGSAINPKFRYNSAEEIFNEIASSVEAFRGLTYKKIGSRGVKIRQKVLANTKI
ncbi:MAG: molybdopterin-dependent oxidoreductase [Bacteroidetes bacterium]|nr:molybdopterin-dependent oxidoreductase [Bacteroidota bacterium]MBU1423090.1 molybdopterin-dependent oxidoreductase [Bacteroidota bacterium]